MTSIEEIRNKYPQYNDISDEDLANKLHQKYYKDVPTEQFNKSIGLGTKEQRQTKSIAQILGQFGTDVSNTKTVKVGTTFVDALGNLPITIGNTLISPFTEQRVETQNTIPGEDFWKILGRAPANALGILGLGAGIGGTTTKALEATGKAVPSVQKGTSYLTSGKAIPAAAGGVGEAATSAALLSPDETLQAAEEAALWQSIFEAAPPIARPLGEAFRYVEGSEFVKEMTKKIQGAIKLSKKEATTEFKRAELLAGDAEMPVFKEKESMAARQDYEREIKNQEKIKERGYVTGEQPIKIEEPNITPKTQFQLSIENIDPSILGKDLQEAILKWEGKPNYKNSFNLQSDLFKREQQIKKDMTIPVDNKEKLTSARTSLIGDIQNLLLADNPEAKKSLERGQYLWATKVLPYERSFFKNIEEGVIGEKGVGKKGALGYPSLQNFEKSLTKEVTRRDKKGKGMVPEIHPSVGSLKEVTARKESIDNMLAKNPLLWIPIIGQHYGINTFKALASKDEQQLLGELYKMATPKVTASANSETK